MTRQDRRFVRIALFVCAVIAAVPTVGRAQSPVDGYDLGASNSSYVIRLQPDGKVLLGGSFTMIGGGGTGSTPREHIARLNADGSVDTGFNPGANEDVWAIAVQPDGKILVGGEFTMIGGGGTGSTPRERIARLNYDGSVDESFNPGAAGGLGANVDEIVLQPDGKILVAGEFQTLAGGTRHNIGRLNANGSLDTSFVSNTDAGYAGGIYAMALQPDGKVLLGGTFNFLNGVARSHLGRLNADGSLDTLFSPAVYRDPESFIEALVVQLDGKILVGGYFTQLAGGSRNHIGRLNANGSLDTGFNPSAGSNDEIVAIVVQPDGKILVAGNLTELGGQPREGVGRVNPDGSPDAGFVDPMVDGGVDMIAVLPDGKVLVAGGFSTVGLAPRSHIARLHADGRVEKTFDPGTNANGTVYALAVQPNQKILAGGAFFTLSGFSSPSFSRFGQLHADGSISNATVAEEIVFATAVQADGKILGGGQFTIFGVAGRPRIGRLFSGFGGDPSFTPGAATGNVGSLAVQPDGKILAAGGFIQLSGATRGRVARLDAAAAIDGSFGDPAAGNTVNTMALQPDGRIVVGGNFLTPRVRIGRIETNGTWDATFTPSADGAVSAVALQADGKILVGGVFANLNGVGRVNIGRLNADGSLDTTFNPGAEGEVSAFAVQTDGKILVGGNFVNLAGASRLRIGRLNADGTIDNTFNPGAIGQPHSLAIQADGKILAAGAFTHLGGGTGTTARLNIGRLTNTTVASQSLWASAGGAILTWMRGGSSPEVSRVTFEISTDGVTYTPLGAGTRIAGGWRLSGQSPPIRQNVYIRARGHYATGYRNGSESIVESVRNFFFGYSQFTDDELTASLSVIKAVHITELRTRINAVRVREGLAAYTFTNSALVVGSSVVNAINVTELRTALAEVYTQMGLLPPSYGTTPAPGVTVRAVDITTLRAATGAVE